MKNGENTEENKGVVSSPSITESTNTSISPVNHDFQFIEALAGQLANINAIAEVFVKGGLCPIKNAPDFTVATVTGMQLGLPMITAVNNIFVVNNKPSLSTHLLRALILKAGITFEKVYDFEPCFQYYDGELKDGKMEAVKGADGNPIFRGTSPLGEIDETKYKAGRKEVDRITKYIFERKLVQPDGSYKDIKVTSSFSMVDAGKAGLLDKDNYNKYPARMLDARAFSIGAREIASDVLFGMYTINEMADANNIKYSMNENFEETIEAEVEIVR